MENLAPRRRFRDPHDLSGIIRVSPRRAIPVRETPLEGTRLSSPVPWHEVAGPASIAR